MRICKKCGKTKPLEEFRFYNKERDWREHRCNDCYNKACAEWRKKQGEYYRIFSRKRYHKKVSEMNSDELKEQRAKDVIKSRKRHRKIKHAIFMAYGGYRCACCGETEKLFLTIDHINNNGAEMRKKGIHGVGISFYGWLYKNNFPLGFQVLCMNCQWGKRNNGVCPHRLTRNDYSVKEVGASVPKRSTPDYSGDDIVCSIEKSIAAISMANSN